MRTVRSTISPRYILTQNKIDGILNYDVDNSYPQRIMDIVNSSGCASRCVNEYGKFIEGQGFSDAAFYKTIVNRKNQSIDKVLSKIARDKARYNGYAIHVNYNALGKVVEIQHVPFEYCRLGDPNNPEYANKIAVYPDWYRQRSSRVRREDIKWYNYFNPDKALSEALAVGFDNYQGQIYWWSFEGEQYPLAPIDPVIEDVESDARIKNHKRKAIATGFNADFALVTQEKFESDSEREEYVANLENFQGDENAGNIMLIEIERPEQKPEVIPFPKQSTDNAFVYTETSIHENIRKCFGIPPVLVGEATAGKLGTSQEIIDACNYYNAVTDHERRSVSETFKHIFSYWHEPNVCPSGDYTILPVTLFDVSNDALSQANQLGANGVQTLTGILNDITMPVPQKLNLVQFLFDLTIEQASALVLGTPLPKE